MLARAIVTSVQRELASFVRVVNEASTLRLIRVLVVSEIRLHREGLTSALTSEDIIQVVDAVDGLRDALRVIDEEGADVVLLDLAPTDDNLAELSSAVRAAPDVRFVVLGAVESEEEVVAWAEAGVSGIVERGSSLEELRRVLDTVMRSELLCSPRVAAALLHRVHALALERSGSDAINRLTVRELEIMDLISQGLTNKEIARRMDIRLPTVKNHVHNIFEKLGVHTRAAAVALSRKIGTGTSPVDLSHR